MVVLFGGERSERTMNDPRANQIDNTVAKTGSADRCTNGYGVHDMVGNVHEWTDDASFRGGYYLDTKVNGDGCDYRTTAHAPSYYDYSTGFRCCADAGPSAE
jgi:formylglycine-generating enzyme